MTNKKNKTTKGKSTARKAAKHPYVVRYLIAKDIENSNTSHGMVPVQKMTVRASFAEEAIKFVTAKLSSTTPDVKVYLVSAEEESKAKGRPTKMMWRTVCKTFPDIPEIKYRYKSSKHEDVPTPADTKEETPSAQENIPEAPAEPFKTVITNIDTPFDTNDLFCPTFTWYTMPEQPSSCTTKVYVNGELVSDDSQLPTETQDESTPAAINLEILDNIINTLDTLYYTLSAISASVKISSGEDKSELDTELISALGGVRESFLTSTKSLDKVRARMEEALEVRTKSPEEPSNPVFISGFTTVPPESDTTQTECCTEDTPCCDAESVEAGLGCGCVAEEPQRSVRLVSGIVIASLCAIGALAAYYFLSH